MLTKYLKDVIFSMATFFLLVISVNIMLFPDTPGFLGLNPHPYLIVVLLMSGRFGLKEGLLAALLASIILSVYVFLENQPYFSWSLLVEKSFLLSIISYFLAALIVGEMRGFNKSYERTLRHENIELKEERTRLKEQLEIVTEIKEELENRIIGQEETVHSLYQSIKALETLNEKQFYQALTQLTARFTGATKVSLYMINYSQDSIQRVAQYGWPDEEGAQKKFPLYEDIFGLVLKFNRMLTIKEISDDSEHLSIWEKCSHKAYAYVPISMASVIVGILTVDDIPFLKLNISTIRILALIAELAVPALKNIIKYQDLQEMVKIDPITELLKYDSFMSVAEVEFKKTVRYQLDFSLLFVEVTGLMQIKNRYGHDVHIEALKWISRKLQQALRSIDIIGLGPQTCQFVLALPVTNMEGMLAVIDRIKKLEKCAADAPQWCKYLHLYYGTASYHPSLDSLDSMIKLAQNSLKLNKAFKLRTKSSKKLRDKKDELGTVSGVKA